MSPVEEMIRLGKLLAESEKIFKKGRKIIKTCEPGVWIGVVLLWINIFTSEWTLFYAGFSVWMLAMVPSTYGLFLIRKACKMLDKEVKMRVKR